LQRRLFGLIDSSGGGGARTTFTTNVERDIYLSFTLFVIGDFLGWCQVVRRHCNIYAPNADSQEKSRRMEEYLDAIVKAWTTTQRPDSFFRLQRGELQALGELFCSPTGQLTAELSNCISFIDFHQRWKEKSELESSFSYWFLRLERDCSTLIDGNAGAPSKERVIEIQRCCVQLIEFLDPVYKVIPKRARRLLPMQKGMKSLTGDIIKVVEDEKEEEEKPKKRKISKERSGTSKVEQNEKEVIPVVVNKLEKVGTTSQEKREGTGIPKVEQNEKEVTPVVVNKLEKVGTTHEKSNTVDLQPLLGHHREFL